MKKYFLTFSDSRIDHSRIEKEAKQAGWFDKVIAPYETNLEPWYLEKYKDRWTDYAFGYWQWKSYLIQRTLSEMEVGDILLYVDAGSHINKDGYSRFLNYIERVNNSESGMLLVGQKFVEEEWTKADVFEYFGVRNNPKYLYHKQIYAGFVLCRKCDSVVRLVDEWVDVTHNHYDLINDSPSKIANCRNFRKPRYDQSILSILSVKYGVDEMDESEILQEDFSKMADYPVQKWHKRAKVEIPLKAKLLRLIPKIRRKVFKILGRI